MRLEHKRQLLAGAFGAALLVGLFGLGALVWAPPIELSELAAPSRVYARPHRIAAGQDLEASGLVARLARLGYRQIEKGTPRPGEFRKDAQQIELHRRAFRTPLASGEDRDVVLAIGRGRIDALREPNGARVASLLLEPEVVGELHSSLRESRELLALDEIPTDLVTAILTLEDRKFEEHGGLDLQRMVGASWANLRAGRIVQGGSTLTQQLVKNYFLTDAQTFDRKATEAVMALRLEAHYSKDEILVAYLNEVFLGQDGERAIHGFGLGSEFYFAKPLGELDAGELALLIGLVKGPSYYDPRRHPDRALARRNLVLKQFADTHLIEANAAQRAAAAPLGLRPGGGSYVPAYIDLVRRHLKRDYAEADLAAAGLSVYTSLDPRAQAAGESALTRDLQRLDAKAAARGGHLQGAVIVAEPNSGDVVAVVGGRETDTAGTFNRALDARRPIGSLVKPAVYLTALESGRYTAASLIEDAPIEMKLPDGSIWAPQNFEHNVNGSVTLAKALAESLNLATVKLGMDLGLSKVADTLQSLGLESATALNPSMLLGTVEMTPLEVVQVYTSLANGGFRARLRAVRAVLDEQGRPLRQFKVQVEPAAPPAAVYQLVRMLMLVPTHGTARDAAARLPRGLVIAGKTGTSSDTRDSWFAGFTGSYLSVVWVGYDDNRVTGLTGAAGALPVWADTMAGLKPVSFEPIAPDSAEDRWIGFDDGLETTPACSPSAVVIGVRKNTVLPRNPRCNPAQPPRVGDKIKSWFDRIVH